MATELKDLVPPSVVRNEDSVTQGNSLKVQKRCCKSATTFIFYSFRIVDLWNLLPEDIINAPTLDTFKTRLDKSWSGHKFISTKLDTKQLNSQNKDYLENNEGNGNTDLLKGPDAYAQWKLCYVMLCYVNSWATEAIRVAIKKYSVSKYSFSIQFQLLTLTDTMFQTQINCQLSLS